MTIWDALGIHCSANERRADEASRDVEAWLKCYFIRDKLGEHFSGTVSGVTPFGIFVQLDDIYIEGMVHISELGTDYFQFDEARHELRGERSGKRYKLTDRVMVQVSRVDLDARRIDLRLVDEPGRASSGRPAPKGDSRRSSFTPTESKSEPEKMKSSATVAQPKFGKPTAKTQDRYAPVVARAGKKPHAPKPLAKPSKKKKR